MLEELRKIYPQSYLLIYCEKCKSKEITIGHELMTMLDILLGYFDDEEIKIDFTDSEKRIKFIESECKHAEAPFAGKPFLLELFQKAFIEAIYIFKVYDPEIGRWITKHKEVLFLVSRKNGKALALDTPIITPNGWKTMRDLAIGDYVFAQDGTPSRIITTSPTFKNHDCYKITFEDGEQITSDAEHIWTVTTKESRAAYNRKCKRLTGGYKKEYRENGGYYDITTKEMANNFAHPRSDGKGTEYKYRVPMQGPIQYPAKDLKVNPYVLGVWLGDGEKTGCRITCSEKDKAEMMMQVEAEGYKVTWHDCKDRAGRFSIHGLLNGLKTYSLVNAKHIPNDFLTGSIEQRLELLKGLMDTDGFCSTNGECEFAQKSLTIVNGFCELLSSLGIKFTVKERTIKCNGKLCDSYRITFFCSKSNPCFKLQRKTARLKDTLSPRMLNKSIINIEKVKSAPTKCIGIDNPSQLYLAGQRMTATHNTPLISALCLAEFFCGPTGTKILCSSNDYDQADLAFQAIDNMREQSPRLERVSRKNIKGIFMGNPKRRRTKGKFSYQNKGNIRKISAKTGAKEGKNIRIGMCDEVHELIDDTSIMPIRQALSTQDEWLYFELTTEGFTDEGYLDKRLKEARQVLKGEIDRSYWLVWLYTQDSEEEVWQNEDSWYKSNPGLGIIKKKSFLRQMVEEAKTNASTRAFVLAKDFNIKQNSASAWLTEADAVNASTFDMEILKNKSYIGSLDFAETTDLCNAKAIVYSKENKKTYSLTMYFIPEDKADALLEDGDDKKLNPEKKNYREWAKQGLVTICPGSEVDPEAVVKWFYSLYKEYGMLPFKIGYDNWHAKDFKRLVTDYFGEEVLEQIRMDFASLSGPMRIVESDLKNKNLIYNNNPIDLWCLKNVSIKMDNIGRIMPVKLQGQSKNRIDGALGFFIAYAALSRFKSEYMSLV